MKSISLYELIDGLNQKQLQAFLKIQKEHKGGGNYLQLCEGILLCKSDKNKILKSELPQFSAKDLSNYKYYLKKEILNFVSSNKTNARKKLDSEILIKSSLYAEAIKSIERNIQAAIKSEDYRTLLLQVQKQNEIIANNALNNSHRETVKRNIELEQDCLNKLLSINKISDVFYQMSGFMQAVGYTRREKDIAKAKEIYQKAKAIHKESVCAKCDLMLHLCYLQFAVITADTKKASEEANNAYAIFSKYNYMVQLLPHDYIKVIYQKVVAYYNAREYEKGYLECEKFDDFKNHIFKKSVHNVFKLCDVYKGILQLTYFLYRGKFVESKGLLSDFENKFFKKADPDIPEYYAMLAEVIFASIYFGLGNYKKSLQAVHQILVIDAYNFREDLLRYCYILRLLLYIENKNFVHLANIIPQTELFLREKSDEQLAFEHLLPSFFKDVAKDEIEGEELSMKSALLLENIEEINYFQGKEFEFFMLMPWLRSKANKTDFTAEVQKNLT